MEVKSAPSSSTRLLYFQQNLAFGLTEQYLYDLIRWTNQKYRVHLVFPDAPELESFQQLKDEGVCLYSLPSDMFAGNSVRAILALSRVFQRIDPDLIHYNDPVVSGILAGRVRIHPTLVVTHHTPELDRGYNWRGRLLERLAFARCEPHVIFTSENDRRTGIEKDGIRAEQSAVIPYGVDLEAFEESFDKTEICQEFNIPLEHRIVGNVARLVEQKGHDYLIAAAEIVLSNFKEVTFVVVGDGHIRENLASKVAHAGLSGRFVFTGQRSDVPRLLSAFDVFVMPSLFEGLCMAVLEALAAGVPVVATPVGGIPSSVVDGETGTLVPPRDARALAEAILWMLDHPEEAGHMGMRGRQRVEEQFTVQAMVVGTEAIYERLLYRRNSQGGLV